MNEINIGLIGFGTVGGAVVKALVQKRELLSGRLGIRLALRKVCDKDIERPRPIKIERGLLTTDVNEVLDAPEIDIVIELIGGIHPAREFILKALAKGKIVVTANKALLAESEDELFKEAGRNGSAIYFEASACGGIPIIKALREGLCANKIVEIYGIVNGTSNYILSKMSDSEVEFRDALIEAKRLGLAEKDPTLDVNGMDSAHKLAILTRLAFKTQLDLDDIYVEGIERISLKDIRYAEELGYAVKLLALAKYFKEELDVRVHPTLVPKSHLLASVRGEFNAVFVNGDLVGEQVYYGRGAGGAPTSSAVVSDVIDAAQSIISGAKGGSFYFPERRLALSDIDLVQSRYYLRIMTLDRPGVLAAIAKILAKFRISIASVIQKETSSEKAVPIVIVTHQSQERDMRRALMLIDRLSFVRARTVAIRIM